MPRIEEMYAFVVEDTGPDDEGVISYNFSGTYGHLPLVGADMKRAESLKPIARKVAQELGKPVKLLHFENRQELEVILPQ